MGGRIGILSMNRIVWVGIHSAWFGLVDVLVHALKARRIYV